jgi:hypothetical protein
MGGGIGDAVRVMEACRERGLGIEIDEDKLARYGEKYFEITASGLAIKTIRDKGLFTALKLARKKRR